MRLWLCTNCRYVSGEQITRGAHSAEEFEGTIVIQNISVPHLTQVVPLNQLPLVSTRFTLVILYQIIDSLLPFLRSQERKCPPYSKSLSLSRQGLYVTRRRPSLRAPTEDFPNFFEAHPLNLYLPEPPTPG